MSFILDALKKSESERQRQSGPALFEVKVAPPRGRFAIWATGLGALLAINLVVVGWMAMRGSANRSTAAAQESSTAPKTATGGAAAATRAAPEAPVTPGASPRTYPAAPPVPAPASRAPDTRFGAVSPSPGTAASEDAHVRADTGEPSAAPEDLAPAVEPEHRGFAEDGGVVRQTETGLPSYQDAAAAPGANLPNLRLDLHVYAPDPDQRFVFINMQKLREGDSLPIGVRVEQITSDGVILSYRGTRFVLQH
ncbi:MAG TPA: general secretion pathway protein GspB [Steroidobacteraceae bacterium]|nr:general secretion pathway protein GspB [Steroidobacteraceae bacterium]